jgi:primosomal protein N' (replication factor Y)
MQYIDAVIDNKSVNTDNFYTYKAPDEVGVGAKLTVPFARRSKSVDAYCVRAGVGSDLNDSRIKEIDTFDPGRSLSSEMVGTAMWMRKRYGIKYIDGLKMFAVDGKREKALKTKVTGPVDPAYRLTSEQEAAADKICASIEKHETKTYLIKGVTNSGRPKYTCRPSKML